jgi:hypothetical protein
VSTRTTLTLEDDVVERLRDVSRGTGKSFKDVVNEAIRTGLDRRGDRPRARFVVKARPMGLKPGFDLDDIEGLIERLEGPLHR